MNKQVNHPYIDLAGILHIALVVNDVQCRHGLNGRELSSQQ